MQAPLRIVFLGSDPIALPLLSWLTGEGAGFAQLAGVFTQPDRPVGRGQKITPNGIKQWALERGLPVHQPLKLGEEPRQILASLQADVALVMAYGHILKQDFIDTPRLGTLNLHASILPRYRGASPIQSAIANGEKETGVSLMRIVRELDAGPVADVQPVPIEPLDTALEIEARLAAACVPLVARNLGALTANSLVFSPQNHAEATFCRRLVKDDGVLDFSAPASEIAARINGLFPWPGCTAAINGQVVKFGLAEAMAGTGAEPGEVLGADAHGLLIACGRDAVRLRRLQRPGGRMLDAAEFLRGWPVAAGTKLPSTPMPPLVAPVPFKR